MKIKKRWLIIFLVPGVSLFIFMYAISLVTLVTTSFTEWRIGISPTFIGLDHYIRMFQDPNFFTAFGNTIVWILLQCTLHVGIALAFALVIARKKRYCKFARGVFMIPNIISSAAIGMLFLCILNPSFGPVNQFLRAVGLDCLAKNWFADSKTAFWAVTLTWLPFAAVNAALILAEMSSIDEDIYEAAAIDGASESQKMRYITLPLLRNIIGTCTILAGTGMLHKFDTIMMTTGGGPGNRTMSMPLMLYNAAMRDNNFGYGNAIGVVMMLTGLVLVFAVNRIYKVGEVK